MVVKSEAPILSCDNYHPALDILLKIDDAFSTLQNNEIKFDFNQADCDAINNELIQFNWLSIFKNNSLGSLIAHFYDKIYFIIQKHVPTYTVSNSKLPVWYSNEIEKILKQKSIAHKKIQINSRYN